MNENITASYFLCLLVLAVFTKMMSTVKDDIIKPVFLRNINSNETLALNRLLLYHSLI